MEHMDSIQFATNSDLEHIERLLVEKGKIVKMNKSAS